MNEEIEKRAIRFLDSMTETIKTVSDNVQEELPSMFQELINYFVIQNICAISICFVLFAILFIIRRDKNKLQASVLEEFKRNERVDIVSIWRIGDSPRYTPRVAYCFVVEIVFWIAIPILSLVFIYKLMNIVYLIVTPRAYILMHILDSMKPNRV